MKHEALRKVLERHEVKPEVFVETGTADGANIFEMAKMPEWRALYTIELSETLFHEARAATRGMERKPIMIFGDSAIVLPDLLRGLDEPCVIYLDAHWCRNYGPKAAEGSFPLFKELDAIAPRKHGDIVIVDDVCDFGGVEPEEVWKNVTFENVVKRLGRVTEHYTVGNEFVCHRSPVVHE